MFIAAFSKEDRTMLDREELFRNTLRKAAHVWKRINELRLIDEEASKLRFFVDEPAYTDLHWVSICFLKDFHYELYYRVHFLISIEFGKLAIFLNVVSHLLEPAS